MGAKGAVEIIFRSDINDPAKIAERTRDYEDAFLSLRRRPSQRNVVVLLPGIFELLVAQHRQSRATAALREGRAQSVEPLTYCRRPNMS
jgi:hypothetical protein